MPIEIKMPALSPTMEQGTLAKWLVKAGDTVRAGDLLAEIETDKATMEFEAVDDGTIAALLIDEGTDDVSVGTIIATLAIEGETASASITPPSAPPTADTQPKLGQSATPAPAPAAVVVAPLPAKPTPARTSDTPVDASPLAQRIAEQQGIDLLTVSGSGPRGRIVKADVAPATPVLATAAPSAPAPAPKPLAIPDIPHEATKLSNMRKTIARRLTESKAQVPHIYLTVDVRLDALLALRAGLNETLVPRNIKLSVNDLLVKALALALIAVPACNVMFTPDNLISFTRADISVAVSTPTGLITPVVQDAGGKSLSRISTEVKDLAARARDNKLLPEEYTGGTASISNMGMYGIKQFEAIINPPQGMILAIGAAEKCPHVVEGQITVATVMKATGSFDHRAIDGADGAAFMRAFQALLEEPLRLAS